MSDTTQNKDNPATNGGTVEPPLISLNKGSCEIIQSSLNLK